jgi:hypothetical protein
MWPFGLKRGLVHPTHWELFHDGSWWGVTTWTRLDKATTKSRALVAALSGRALWPRPCGRAAGGRAFGLAAPFGRATADVDIDILADAIPTPSSCARVLPKGRAPRTT